MSSVPPWTNQDIVLYHGTVDSYAPAIVSGVQVELGRLNKDFGPGFYTTTTLQQARSWAARIAPNQRAKPAVVQITVQREALAGLQALTFIRGHFSADDYWSFVHHCRAGATDHFRPDPHRFYDVVYGPLAGLWRQRMVIPDTDQISFHTAAAQNVLNKSVRKRII